MLVVPDAGAATAALLPAGRAAIDHWYENEPPATQLSLGAE